MVKFAMNIAPLTAAERQELGEILAGLGLFGGRRNVTHYSRTTKVGNTTPKGSKMQTVPRAKYDALKAEADALKAKAAIANTIILAHYDAGDPIAITASQYGLTADEVGAVRQPVAARALEEYARSSDRLRHGGTNLTSYMQGAYVDERAGEVPPLLQSACTKLQQHFGPVVDMAGGGLTYV